MKRSRFIVAFILFFSFAAMPRVNAQVIAVTSPDYRSDVHGKIPIHVSAVGYNNPLKAKSWLPGGQYGSDSTVASISLDGKGSGSFDFHADRYPHGPIMVRITGKRISDGYVDTCYLQLYNTGGVPWNEGIPKAVPPGAAGMSLVFEDDFDGPLSISGTGYGARYGAHKPDGLDFSQIPFSDPTQDGPFFQRDTYLIIRANALRNTTGLISSINSRDATGFTVKAPYYMECRFIAPDAIGTWPAWWTMTDEYKDGKWGDKSDELDIIEAYGGDGPKHPNAPREYMVTPHMWGYHTANIIDKANPIDMRKVGGGGGWADTPHTYGLLVTANTFVFYLDNIEILRLPASPLAVHDPTYFMVNLATGGGWPVDLSRYGNIVDMYVDYIRVYH
ncbi:MAG: glycoside hydrolase family 16 protein [Terracidiphilus sp.]